MEKIYHKKLIRDKIPQIIEDNDGKYETRKLKGGEFEEELKEKLVEEAEEVGEAQGNELEKELSDVLQVVKSIAELKDIEFSEVEKKQKQRKEERGGFKKRLFLIWSNQEGGN